MEGWIHCVFVCLCRLRYWGWRREAVVALTESLTVYSSAEDEDFGADMAVASERAFPSETRASRHRGRTRRVLTRLAPTSADTRPHYLCGCYGKDVSCIPLPAKLTAVFHFSSSSSLTMGEVRLPSRPFRSLEGWRANSETAEME